MALVPLATKGNFVHVYDFRVTAGRGEEFIALFNSFDYSDVNPFHTSEAQAKDGVLCRDVDDPDHFWLLGEWKDIEAHKEMRKIAEGIHPQFVNLIEGAKFVPKYGEIVSATPQDVLDRAGAARS